MLAHIAGVPVEETVLSLVPALLTVGSFLVYGLRKLPSRVIDRTKGDSRRLEVAGQ